MYYRGGHLTTAHVQWPRAGPPAGRGAAASNPRVSAGGAGRAPHERPMKRDVKRPFSPHTTSHTRVEYRSVT